MGPADNAFDVPEPPPVLVPVPAVRVFDLHSRRVVCGAAGSGWRFDLRADDPVDRDGAMLVPVISEADYYRAVDGDGDAYGTLVHADEVWVQRADPNPAPSTPPPGYLIDRLSDPDAPPVRRPLAASDVPDLMGRRVWYWTGREFRDDFRCVSEPFETSGDFCVRVAEEAGWYRWQRTGRPPKPVDAFIQHLWTQ
ncbi:hypothetical protein [Glycomyces xiaoerkulensis]|uniref:hypothetical protein n=1 Tax=Glycomyces xiaoerkulensis TaxID=2038139 RepID=UPI000C264487|nr:hypothetical protein [Glycomyces xiaoerkulensis]